MLLVWLSISVLLTLGLLHFLTVKAYILEPFSPLFTSIESILLLLLILESIARILRGLLIYGFLLGFGIVLANASILCRASKTDHGAVAFLWLDNILIVNEYLRHGLWKESLDCFWSFFRNQSLKSTILLWVSWIDGVVHILSGDDNSTSGNEVLGFFDTGFSSLFIFYFSWPWTSINVSHVTTYDFKLGLSDQSLSWLIVQVHSRDAPEIWSIAFKSIEIRVNGLGEIWFLKIRYLKLTPDD